ALSDELKVADQSLRTLLLALQVDGGERNCYSQAGLLAFHFDPRDCGAAKAEVLTCDLLLQALLVCCKVRRLLTPQRRDACEVLFAIGSKILLDHGTKGRFL